MAVQQWTTTGFELTPAGDASPAEGDDRIRELKETAGSLLDKEHLARDAGSTAAQGWHREGSAIAYYEASEPANRPDGATALGATDAGRLWADSDDKALYVYTGSAWDQITPGAAESDLLDGLDQSLATTDSPTFAAVTATGTIQAEQLTSTDDATVTDDLTVGGNINITGLLNGVGVIYLDGSSLTTHNALFDAISPYMPTTGDCLLATGQATGSSTPLPVVYLKRTSSTVVTVYYVNSSGSLSTRTWTNGSGTGDTGVRIAALAAYGAAQLP